MREHPAPQRSDRNGSHVARRAARKVRTQEQTAREKDVLSGTTLSIVVPCFNEEDALPLFYEEASEVLQGMGCTYELLLVDDGSKDGTLEVMRGLAASDQHVSYLSFSRNFGKEAALYAGLENARGNYVATMDADLQDPPSLLPEMLEILQTGEYDCVATRREDRVGEPKVRSWFSRLFYRIMDRISDIEFVDGARDFRMMGRGMVDAIVSMREVNRFSKGIYSWVGFRTCWISYGNVERAAGRTKWSFRRLFRYAVEGIVDFSQVPLDIASWCGLLLTAVAFVMVIFVIVRKLAFGDPVQGWASTICVIMFIGGVATFCIGVLGQYVSRIYTETKARPHYIVTEAKLASAGRADGAGTDDADAALQDPAARAARAAEKAAEAAEDAARAAREAADAAERAAELARDMREGGASTTGASGGNQHVGSEKPKPQ